MYTSVKNVQILISLFKQKGIKHFVNSPGTRNTPLVHSIEEDPFFTCYSIVDERSAGYFALGLSEALDAPVCVTCTAATATCNYMPAIKEAYERNIQLVALTADRELYYLYNMQDQLINQMNMYDGFVKHYVDIPIVNNSEDEWYANRCINEALLELDHNGKGPIQINYRVTKLGTFNVEEVQKTRNIERISNNFNWKEIQEKIAKKDRIIVFCGSNYSEENEKLKQVLKEFNNKYNSVIFIDHYSNLTDEDFVYPTVISECLSEEEFNKMIPNLIITFGNVFYPPIKFRFNGKKQNFEHWHIDSNGVVNDGFRNLKYLFECAPIEFFENIVKETKESKENKEYYKLWQERIDEVNYDGMKFTNFTAIRDLVKVVPENSTLHMSVLNSIRISNYYRFVNKVTSFANIGADGIDGALSTFLGQARASKELAFLIIGDLSYIYDLNASINIKDKNIRIMVINNYAGAEFHKNFGLEMIPTLNLHIAAGHKTQIGQCTNVIKNVNHMVATNQEELDKCLEEFIKPSDKPVILEVITDADTDAKTLKGFWNNNRKVSKKEKVKNIIKRIIGEKGKAFLKKVLRKG